MATTRLRTAPSPYIRALHIPRDIDVADSHIVREVALGYLLVTADIPFAASPRSANPPNPRRRNR